MKTRKYIVLHEKADGSIIEYPGVINYEFCANSGSVFLDLGDAEVMLALNRGESFSVTEDE